jgi:hypothetical protein
MILPDITECLDDPIKAACHQRIADAMADLNDVVALAEANGLTIIAPTIWYDPRSGYRATTPRSYLFADDC